ncbi:MAG: RNA polymerase sigma factor [Actinomycetota bacterium]
MTGYGTVDVITDIQMSAQPAGKLEQLYLDHIDGAVRLAYLLTGDEQQARDIGQDAFVKIAGRFHGIRDPDAFSGYLRTTVINLCRGYMRRLRTQRDYLARQSWGAPPVTKGPDVEGRDEMWQALQTLPHRQRAALVLRYYQDLSERQIADAMESSESAVKSLLSRGLEQLRAQMRGEQ